MEEIINEQLESIKLTKNAKGDMQYEIKIYAKELEAKDIDRLDTLRKDLELKYGSKN
jgi:hypothetical protein